jgi:tetratricopeptide (TPR) repeat protein
MKNFFCILFIFLTSSIAPTAPLLSTIERGIRASIAEKYDTALALFDSLKQNNPQHPAGHFFFAAVLQARMTDLETQKWQDDFHKHIDQAIVLARKNIDQNDGIIPFRYYFGAGLSYKSLQLGREKKYLPAIKLGMAAVDELEKTMEQNPAFFDPLLGIGLYQYWRSHLTKSLTWLPFFSDQRTEGIEKIIKAAENSEFSRWAALSSLAWIYMEEQQYEQAYDYAHQGYDEIPSRFFLWPMAEAAFRQEKFALAIDQFKRILASLQSGQELNNHYNELVLNWKLAQAFAKIHDWPQAEKYCNLVLNLKVGEKVKERAKDEKKGARDLLKHITAAQKK